MPRVGSNPTSSSSLVHWSSGLSRLPVTEEIMGSNPIWTVDGGIGEGVNTLVCGSSMRGFDSHIPPHNGGLAQLGEHLPYKQEVTGSSPVSSIVRDYRRCGSLFLCKKNEQAKLLFYRFKS